MAKTLLYGLMLMAVLQSCERVETDYNPDKYLTQQQKDSLLISIIRYVAKSPEQVSEREKFSATYDSYYWKKLSEARLEQYLKREGEVFFLISQPASSITVKRHATGGKFRTDEADKIVEYEEIFRTWKMTLDVLQARSYFLFDKMVNDEPLSPFYTENSKGVDYIEFPDHRTYFDKVSRTWKLKQQN